MMYDVKMHIPTQIENMLQAEQNIDILGFERALNNIKEMMSENGFIQDLRDYEKEKDKRLEPLDKEYQDLMPKMLELEEQIKGIYNEYMNTVKTYVLNYMPNISISGYEQ